MCQPTIKISTVSYHFVTVLHPADTVVQERIFSTLAQARAAAQELAVKYGDRWGNPAPIQEEARESRYEGTCPNYESSSGN